MFEMKPTCSFCRPNDSELSQSERDTSKTLDTGDEESISPLPLGWPDLDWISSGALGSSWCWKSLNDDELLSEVRDSGSQTSCPAYSGPLLGQSATSSLLVWHLKDLNLDNSEIQLPVLSMYRSGKLYVCIIIAGAVKASGLRSLLQIHLDFWAEDKGWTEQNYYSLKKKNIKILVLLLTIL